MGLCLTRYNSQQVRLAKCPLIFRAELMAIILTVTGHSVVLLDPLPGPDIFGMCFGGLCILLLMFWRKKKML